MIQKYILCPTTYQTRQFFNKYKTNEDIAKRFEQEYVRRWEMKGNVTVVRFKFRLNILISGKIIKELPGLIGTATPCTFDGLQAYIVGRVAQSV
jgi:hypothetical protein